MNTPAHIAASLLVWRNEPTWLGMAAVTFGATLPDLPMFGFYVYQKIVGSTEIEIWSQLYFEERWQLFFDVFNSIPLAILCMVVFAARRRPFLGLIAVSALLHMLCDLPVHHDDAHRHFVPLSNWRFQSPLSYWDPKHHGIYFAVFEFCFALAVSGFLAVWGKHRPMRVAGRVNLGLYFLGLMLVGILWLQLAP